MGSICYEMFLHYTLTINEVREDFGFLVHVYDEA